MSFSAPITLQKICLDDAKKADITLFMARTDQLHELASGNKIYKLHPIIEYAKSNNFKQILSFGGAYSNHIHALALLAKQHRIKSMALIRGEAKYANNPTLSDAQAAGMQLEFVTRAEYQHRYDQDYLEGLKQRYPDTLIVPEGGSSQLAIQGCVQMARDIHLSSSTAAYSDNLAVASGTGATAAGLICGLAGSQRLHAYAVLKDGSLQSRIDTFIQNEGLQSGASKYSIHAADYGGYAKFDQSLLEFILQWLDQTGVLLDPIYTSKMCKRVMQQINAGVFAKGESITLIHSGGLQGWRGMQARVEALGGSKAWQQISESLR